MLTREALTTIYKAFVRPHLDCGDYLFDQTFNALSHEELESIQYNVCLQLKKSEMFHLNLLYLKNNNLYLKTNNFVLTGKTSGTSKEKLYQELCIESLQLRCWYKKLCLFYKMFKNKSPAYLWVKQALFTQTCR